MEKLRVGVIGVGHMGQHHARIMAQNPDCQLTAVADRDRERAEKIAHMWGAEGFKRYRKIYEMVDAVVIAVPTSLHHEVASEFLSRGIHCMVEKPIAASVEEAEDLIRIANEHNCILQVGHVERYNAAIRHLREILDCPVFIECHRMGPFSSRISDVGVVLDLMIHDIDIVLQIAQSPLVSMDAVGVNVLTEKEDIANVRMKFASGCTANLSVSRVSPKIQRKIRVFQRDTYVSIDYVKESMELHQRVPRPNAAEGEPKAEIIRKRVRLKKEDRLTLELNDFVRAIREGANPTVSGENARDALRVAVEVARAITENNIRARVEQNLPAPEPAPEILFAK